MYKLKRNFLSYRGDASQSNTANVSPTSRIRSVAAKVGDSRVVQLFQRISKIIRANFDSIRSQLKAYKDKNQNIKNPEWILEQSILDKQEDLVQLRGAVARATATQQRTERQYNQLQANVKNWQECARVAREKGDKDLEQEAKMREEGLKESAKYYQMELVQQKAQVNTLKRNLITVESQIAEAKTKKDLLQSRIANAKAQEQLQNILSGLGNGSAIQEALKCMEEKVLEREARVQAAAGATGLEQDFTLHYVKEEFGIKLTEDDQFFREWIDDLPELTNLEKQTLDRVKANYLYLAEYPMPQNLVKMVVVSPLLALASFYSSPFQLTAEKPVRIAAKDEAETVQATIDVLVLQNQLWIIVIEAKKYQFSLELGIPTALANMMTSPNLEKPAFGLVTNGSNFIFIKLTQQETPQFALSDEFTLRRGHDLYIVLGVLKRLGAVLTQDFSQSQPQSQGESPSSQGQTSSSSVSAVDEELEALRKAIDNL